MLSAPLWPSQSLPGLRSADRPGSANLTTELRAHYSLHLVGWDSRTRISSPTQRTVYRFRAARPTPALTH